MPAEIWAAEEGFIWRRSHDLQALGEAVRRMPRFDGKPPDAWSMGVVLQQGARNDTSVRAIRDGLAALDERIAFDLRADQVTRE